MAPAIAQKASPVASHYVHRSEHYGAIRKTISIKFCVLSPEIPGDEEVYIFHRFGFC